MKTKFPPLPWPWIAAYALILLLGTIALWQLQSILEQKKSELTQVLQQQQQLLRRRFTPVNLNVQAIQQTLQDYNSLQKNLQPFLHTGIETLKPIREINAINFKEKLAEKVKQLTQKAKENNIRLPQNFYFGYSLYNSEINPPDRATPLLQKQLLAIETLVLTLYQAGIEQIHAIRRAPDPAEPQSSSVRGASHPDYLPISSSLSTSGHYTNIPIEIEFSARTESLRKALNALHKSPYLLVPRALEIKSSRTSIPRLSDFQTQSAEQSDPTVPILALGDETVRVTLRSDLVEWSSTQGTEHISVKSNPPAQNP
ncbi:MAG: Amuc_1100 family pilus-like protein [Methylacidiphilales bacterium]|nr:Amuc_1100 family pilus-like protein [Candidatus Methylacidiphilales bacterium]MDW8349211.1 Amuc_1100 family pilus-like protein [Verrucomicrobiae bacterium]